MFILYGCFIPFHFNFDPNFVRWRWTVFLTESLREDAARPSLSDIVSNILLFVPFGILSVWARAPHSTDRAGFLAIVRTTLTGLLFAIIIESGQTVAPGRDPSMLDALCNGMGTFIGAAWGSVLIRGYRKYLQTEFIRTLCRQPSLLLLAYLLFGMVIDSYFPFEVTLDVSSLWHNIKSSQLVPFRSTSYGYWLDLSVDKGIPYSLIAYLILINLRRFSRPLTAGMAWLLAVVFACAIESGKLFFAGRAFHSDNLVIVLLGALVGVIFFPRLCTVASVKRHREAVWFMLVLGFLVYFEMSPFDWIAIRELPGRFSAIEWLPFKSYYYGEPIAALFDLQKKVYSFIPLGCFTAALVFARAPRQSRLKPALLCVLIAVCLELFQVGLRSRIPSTGDMIIFSFSAWVGIVLFDLIKSLKQ
ncbi:MAG: VanZ family protein [Betaproteobacteria bacterium]